MYIKIDNLSKKYGEEPLFEKVNLMFTDSHRVGLVGKNGTGKTTFLKILAKLIKQERGHILIDPPKSRIVYHAQVLENEWLESGENEEGYLTSFQYLISQKPEFFTLWRKINSGNESFDYTELIAEYTQLKGYEFEDRIIKALKRLKLDPDQEVRTLSGGQKTRLQFGKLLIEDHEILLLDEPTNHLDIDGIEWFYNYIENYKGIVIIATHDRNLLTRSINKIIEFEDKQLHEYSGNYEYYRKKKLETRISAESKMKQNERRVDKLNEAAKSLENRINRHEVRAKEAQRAVLRVARLTKKNRSAKTTIIKKKLSLYRDNDKLTRNFKLDRQAVKFKANRSSLLTKADRVDTGRKKIGWNMKIDFNTPVIESDFVVRVKKLSKSFDDKKVLDNLTLTVMKNEKVALTGPNGSGKTTLLKSIVGEIKDYTGEIYIPEAISVGYLEQETESLDFESTVLAEFLTVTPRLTDAEARSFLHFFLFEGDQPLRKVKTLSEGEKLKLKLAKLLYSNHNLLLLDEPTNHLDIASQEVIEKALKDFEGCIILVTHDEALIKGVGINKIVQL
jgi:ATP-binding cassette, subfamily F, member 3